MSNLEKFKKLTVFSNRIISGLGWDVVSQPQKKADCLEELFVQKPEIRFTVIKRDIYETFLSNKRGCILTGRGIGYSASILIIALFESFSQSNHKTVVLSVNHQESKRLIRLAVEMLTKTFSGMFCQDAFLISNDSKMSFQNGSTINFVGGYRYDILQSYDSVHNLIIDGFSKFSEREQSELYSFILTGDKKGYQKVLIGSPPMKKYTYKEVKVPSVVYDVHGNEFHLPQNTTGYKQGKSTFYTLTQDPFFKTIRIPSHHEESFKFMEADRYAAEFGCKFIENKLSESCSSGEFR